MSKTASRSARWLAPHGWSDLGIQLGLLGVCYAGYQAVRGLVDQSATQALWHAGQIIHLEQALGLFIEPSVQAWTLGQHILPELAAWIYLNSHYLVSISVLLWAYHLHRDRFPRMRNSFLIAMLLALVGYALFPTAPPRMIPGWGFHDLVAQASGVSSHQQAGSMWINMYAAVPSMHVCFALLIGGWAYRLADGRWLRRLWILYPLVVVWVVIATANHYLTDVLLGGLVALVSVTGAWTWGRFISPVGLEKGQEARGKSYS